MCCPDLSVVIYRHGAILISMVTVWWECLQQKRTQTNLNNRKGIIQSLG